MDLSCNDVEAWKEALSSYGTCLSSLGKPDLPSLDDFYRAQLPSLLCGRDPNPFLTKSELSLLMRWKLSRGKWRPRLLAFVEGLEEGEVESASRKAFGALPDLSKAVSELTVLKGVGPATASAILAAYAPEVAPFMSDEGMVAALGNSKDYTLKQYLSLAEKLQRKATELSSQGTSFTASDIERALWSSAMNKRTSTPSGKEKPKGNIVKSVKRKRRNRG